MGVTTISSASAAWAARVGVEVEGPAATAISVSRCEDRVVGRMAGVAAGSGDTVAVFEGGLPAALPATVVLAPYCAGIGGGVPFELC